MNFFNWHTWGDREDFTTNSWIIFLFGSPLPHNIKSAKLLIISQLRAQQNGAKQAQGLWDCFASLAMTINQPDTI